MSERALAALRLHRGEGRTVALLVGIAFLADAGVMVAQSAIDALFFARYGVGKLPLMYALVGAVTTLGLAVLLTRAGRARAFLLIPAVIFAVALASRAALEAHAGWVYAVLWLVRNIAQSTLILAVWGLAGLVADTRQAKRWFPVIAAGGVMGLVVGGVVTAFEMLRDHSRHNGHKLVGIAQAVVDSHLLLLAAEPAPAPAPPASSGPGI